MEPQRWDARYAEPGFAYGDAPNDFLAAVAKQIPAGPVLTIGEGEGRNAMFLASLGDDVLAVDQSEVGLTKARRRAEERGLTVRTQAADLRDEGFTSDFHQLGFFRLDDVVDLVDMVIVDLLQVLLRVLDVVLGDTGELLQPVARLGAGVGDFPVSVSGLVNGL